MNNQPFNPVSIQSFQRPFNLLLILCGAFVLAGFAASPVFGQKAMWRYVTTSLSGTKTYLNDERKALPGRNPGAWEKMVDADGSSAVTLVEWDCANKSRLIRRITYFNSRQSAVGGKDKGFEWAPVIPGSAGDFLYHRICLRLAPPKLARIVADRTALHSHPDEAATVTRIARRDEQFHIIPETGLSGWFNLVDPVTQEDYWLTGDAFKTVTAASAAPKTNAAKNKLSKPRKAGKRARKN